MRWAIIVGLASLTGSLFLNLIMSIRYWLVARRRVLSYWELIMVVLYGIMERRLPTLLAQEGIKPTRSDYALQYTDYVLQALVVTSIVLAIGSLFVRGL
jgi:multisubunit Na+/H+ antiporter MnhC subunit